MKRDFLKEIQEEIENLRSGKSVVELDEDRSAKIPERRRGFVQVTLPKATFDRLSRLAKKRHKQVEEIIEEMARTAKDK